MDLLILVEPLSPMSPAAQLFGECRMSGSPAERRANMERVGLLRALFQAELDGLAAFACVNAIGRAPGTLTMRLDAAARTGVEVLNEAERVRS